jgi:hypothetical protein
MYGKTKLSTDYSAEWRAFPRYNPRKDMSFRELSCAKAGFSVVKSAKSKNLPRIILR